MYKITKLILLIRCKYKNVNVYKCFNTSYYISNVSPIKPREPKEEIGTGQNEPSSTKYDNTFFKTAT